MKNEQSQIPNLKSIINKTEGLQHTSRQTVTPHDTARHHGSGDLSVLATPALIALLENAAMLAVSPCLSPDESTVGVEIALSHKRASPVGSAIEATATLVKVDGRKLFFQLIAHDEKGEIGSGTHTRYIIHRKRFMEKVER
ncbi:MAG: thioesterase family protein [Prevotellaceae bacterium]|jgi:predicted thioesterase|nr:thioesterase family protein [Prevotellaceae bacterium]